MVNRVWDLSRSLEQAQSRGAFFASQLVVLILPLVSFLGLNYVKSSFFEHSVQVGVHFPCLLQ